MTGNPEHSAPEQETSLGDRVARATAWIVAGRLGVRLAGFVNMLIVARLLVPDDFGLVAIGLTMMQLLQNVSDMGIAQTVIRMKNATKADLDTLFTLSAARGVVTALVLVGIAPLAVTVYGDERLFSVFMLIALHPLLTGFVNPRFFEFERDIDFSKDFRVALMAKLIEVATAITIAVIFRSYIALIAGLVAGGCVRLILSYVMRPWLPGLALTSFRQVFGFMGWLTGISFAAALNNKLDALILGRIVGPAGTGLYYVGEQLAELATRESGEPIARALYPGFATLSGTPERMREVFLQGVAALAIIALPAAIGFALVADLAVPLILGTQWTEAVPVIQFIGPVLGLQSLVLATQSYAMAQDRPQLVFWREVAFFMFRTPIFITGAVMYGLIGAIAATALTGLGHLSLNLHLYQRLSGAPFWQPLWVARRSLIGVAVMAGVLAALRPALAGLPDYAALAILIASGGSAFAGTLITCWYAEGRPDGIERTIRDKVLVRLLPKAA
ncbi:lipopolysaccharide biosynthesis protein [Aquisalinus flavus]|uniref:Lipopolysaccharide biosynthesis protein n=1 Tax=Aquisalinus flavus TaxID=1526572 RepID=A0A8J2Y6D8_9PROT|nr:lipopolysaccharide biosynthesis protein [Aquisalinus flavus]MBD0426339.1 lipopolysaccharide biosynthesis protein [Aquisalinus flavus]UNE48095.1 lipopolysaccharide biosynthesis protein [Aquisalinus flavus]GGD08768.1 hypothetical protein GCM10011342_16980 [Aquisalinus flavus]